MRALHAAVTIIVLMGLAACGGSKPPVMPDVVSRNLDVALSDIERAGFSKDVEVLGGGVLGIIDKGNWVVCEQEPAAGQAIEAKPRLKVDRACGGATPAPAETNTVAATPAPQTTPTALPSPTTPSASPTPTGNPMICETGPFEEPCKFGQTAIYSDHVRSGDVKLEITVGAPVEFTLSKDAIIAYDLPPHPVNVYFPITVKNIAPGEPHGTSVLSQATNAQQGPYDGIREVSDGDVESFALGGVGQLRTGESLTVKEGWSMTTLEGVEYRLAIDGLAGYTVEFTR